MSKFSVKKPFTIFVAVFFVLILGVVSFTRMSTDLLPNISLPYVVVVTTYPGAAPDKVERTVTKPLESGLGTVNGVLNVTSTSSENYSMVMLEFEENTNMDSAMVKLSSALDLIALPDETGSPMILELSANMLPVMYSSVDYEGMDIYELSDFVEETVVPTLERQNGVASVDTLGLINKTVEIRLNPDKIDDVNNRLKDSIRDKFKEPEEQLKDGQKELDKAKDEIEQLKAFVGPNAEQVVNGLAEIEAKQAELDAALEELEETKNAAVDAANLDALLNMETLSGIIYAQNFAMPAGYIYQDDDQYLLKVGDEYKDVNELENALLTEIEDVGKIRLKDVADVTWIDNSGEQYTKVNGRDGIVITISKSSTAATAEVSKTCNAAIKNLMDKYNGLRIVNLMDQGDYIDMIVGSVLQNLIIGAVLAMIVLAIFLKAVMPTLVVAFSIPLSVLVAIVLMYLTGISLNILSLSGLALAIGMLVDNSIVVIENIYRLRGLGVSAPKAAVMGAKQVSGAIIASTLTTICVFLPIIFTTGLVKELFVDLALTMAFALLASLLIALSVVPAMSSTLLRNKRPKDTAFMQLLYRGYEKVLRFFLKVKIIPIAIAAGLLIFCGIKAMNTGMILFPEMGGNQMSATMTFDPELEDEEVFARADIAMEKMAAIPGVEYVGIMSGSSNAASASAMSLLANRGGTHSLNIFILLDEPTSKDNTGVAASLDKICAELEPDDYTVSKSNMDMSSYLAQGLEVNIYGPDNDVLLSVSRDVMDIVGQVKGFINISNGQEEANETIELTVDKDKAMKLGITVAQVVQELSDNLTTSKTPTALSYNGKEYDITLKDENKAVNVDELMDYEFKTESVDENGDPVTETHKLSEFVTMNKGEGLAKILRENQRNYIKVTAEPDEGRNTTLLTRELEEKLKSYSAPEGYSIEIGGEAEEIKSALKDVILMIILAIMFIYLIMVAQFQSLLSPFIVIFTIPLAFTGGFIGLFIAGENISLTAMIGFLMLTGIIVNNGIVFVDYVNQLRLHGMERREALIKAGRNRMRPILMTTLTTVLSMCVMVFSTDAASAMSRGMAIVVIGGLLYATLMTLFVIPVLYDIFFKKELKVVDVGTDEELNSLPDDVY